MEGNISVSAVHQRAERLRRSRQHVSGMPPGRERDELQSQLAAEASRLAKSKLQGG